MVWVMGEATCEVAVVCYHNASIICARVMHLASSAFSYWSCPVALQQFLKKMTSESPYLGQVTVHSRSVILRWPLFMAVMYPLQPTVKTFIEKKTKMMLTFRLLYCIHHQSIHNRAKQLLIYKTGACTGCEYRCQGAQFSPQCAHKV